MKNPKIKQIVNYALEGVKEGVFTTHIFPYMLKLIKKEANKDDSNISNIEIGSFVAPYFGSLFLQLPLYSYLVNKIGPEALIPLGVTNLGSLVYENFGRRKIKKWRNKMKKQKDEHKVKKLFPESKTIDTKLSFRERLKGKARINIQPEVSLNPEITVYVNDEKQRDVRVDVKNSNEKLTKVSLDDYLIKDEPFYMSMNGEMELFGTAYKNKLPFMLKGPTGCGKTRFVEHMAYNLQKPLITVSCQEDLSAADLTGRILLNQEGTYWQDGPLTNAVRHGAICYLDEVVEARNDVMVLIHSLTDHRRILTLEKTGETIPANDDFMLVVSYNPHYQSALKEMKQSTRQRFLAMDFDYPDTETETEIVQKESRVEYNIAKKLVNFGQKIREMKGNGLVEGASTRLLIYGGKLINSGISEYKSVVSAIVSPLTDEQDLKNTITDYAKDYFR